MKTIDQQSICIYSLCQNNREVLGFLNIHKPSCVEETLSPEYSHHRERERERERQRDRQTDRQREREAYMAFWSREGIFIVRQLLEHGDCGLCGLIQLTGPFKNKGNRGWISIGGVVGGAGGG